MTQRVTDEQLVRWTRSNDSALNDVSADCQDARAEVAALRLVVEAFAAAQDLRDEIGSFYDPTQKPREYANQGDWCSAISSRRRWIAASKEADAALRAYRERKP